MFINLFERLSSLMCVLNPFANSVVNWSMSMPKYFILQMLAPGLFDCWKFGIFCWAWRKWKTARTKKSKVKMNQRIVIVFI